MMGCGIAHFGRRGLETTQTDKIWSKIVSPGVWTRGATEIPIIPKKSSITSFHLPWLSNTLADLGGVTLLGKCYASLPSQPSCQGTFLYTCSGRRPRVAPLRAAYPYPVLTVHAAPCPIQITSGGSAVLCNFQMKQYFVSKFLHGIGQIGMNIGKHYFIYECCKKKSRKTRPTLLYTI